MLSGELFTRVDLLLGYEYLSDRVDPAFIAMLMAIQQYHIPPAPAIIQAINEVYIELMDPSST